MARSGASAHGSSSSNIFAYLLNCLLVQLQLAQLRLVRLTRRRGAFLLIKLGVAALLLICFFLIVVNRPSGHEDPAAGKISSLDFIPAKAAYERKKEPAQLEQPAVESVGEKSIRIGSGASDASAIAIFKEGELGNYEIVDPTERHGAGERGVAVHLNAADSQRAKSSMREFGFNEPASEMVSLDRSIPDTRADECKHWQYPRRLPRTSVVIVFHNEMWSTLLRTVHSIINRTPKELLEEILLVDDFSDKAHLKERLDNYVKMFSGRVRVLRLGERQGLIRAKSIGAENANGEIVFFLDAHCEVGYNWLPPLVTPIARDRTVMTVPVIDGIDVNDFSIRAQYQGSLFRGIFEWGLLYKESELPPSEAKSREHQSEPYRSPTHAGGLFAIDRQYFLRLGGYDPGLLVWGGENFELSFKIWQCGGSILWVPCSHIGHIYRGFMPYSFGKLAAKAKGPVVTINYKRVAEVWMDEYAESFYTREPLARYFDAGDISKQKRLRQELGCKPFSWFIDNVAIDVKPKYPALPPNKHWGELVSAAQSTICWDSMGQLPPSVVGATPCHHHGGNQLFRINGHGQLASGEWCVDASGRTFGTPAVQLKRCDFGTTDGPWKYDEAKQQMRNEKLDRCATLTQDGSQTALRLVKCDDAAVEQKWRFEINRLPGVRDQR